jgi:riboflavin-specific deaminase-like protein
MSKRNAARPFVIMSTAMSVDGKIGTRERTRLRLSSAVDAKAVDRLRAECDAIMIGGVTLRHDDPHLTVKDAALVRRRVADGKSAQPLKVAVIGKLTPRAGRRFFHTGGKRVVFTTTRTSAKLSKMLAGVADVRRVGGSVVDLRRAMRILREEYGVKKLMLEGGSTLNFAMLAAGCVDRLRVAVAPLVFGGTDWPTLVGGRGFDAHHPLKLRRRKIETVGDMTILHFDVR